MYKILRVERIDWCRGPQFIGGDRTRLAARNSMALRRETFPSRVPGDPGRFVEVRHEFFLNRVSVGWNELSDSQVLAPSVNSFKSRLEGTTIMAATA